MTFDQKLDDLAVYAIHDDGVTTTCNHSRLRMCDEFNLRTRKKDGWHAMDAQGTAWEVYITKRCKGDVYVILLKQVPAESRANILDII